MWWAAQLPPLCPSCFPPLLSYLPLPPFLPSVLGDWGQSCTHFRQALHCRRAPSQPCLWHPQPSCLPKLSFFTATLKHHLCLSVSPGRCGSFCLVHIPVLLNVCVSWVQYHLSLSLLILLILNMLSLNTESHPGLCCCCCCCYLVIAWWISLHSFAFNLNLYICIGFLTDNIWLGMGISIYSDSIWPLINILPYFTFNIIIAMVELRHGMFFTLFYLLYLLLYLLYASFLHSLSDFNWAFI